MQLNGIEVSERFSMTGVFCRVDSGDNPRPWRKLVFVTPFGEVRADFTEDLPDLVQGGAYEFGLRLYHPEFKRPKFERRFVCDYVEACPII